MEVRPATPPAPPAAAAAPVFCKDCKHFKKELKDPATCTAASTQKIDLVYGYKNPRCSEERRSRSGMCGETGKLFALPSANVLTSGADGLRDLA